MKEHVQLDGLLFTNDTQVLGVMNQILESFAIVTEVCSELDPALDAVTHRRLDAVIVDRDSSDPTQLLERQSSPNLNSPIVAMVNGNSETHALAMGSNFMIHKQADTSITRAAACEQLTAPCCKIDAGRRAFQWRSRSWLEWPK